VRERQEWQLRGAEEPVCVRSFLCLAASTVKWKSDGQADILRCEFYTTYAMAAYLQLYSHTTCDIGMLLFLYIERLSHEVAAKGIALLAIFV